MRPAPASAARSARTPSQSVFLPRLEKLRDQAVIEDIEKLGERSVPEGFAINCDLRIGRRQRALRTSHPRKVTVIFGGPPFPSSKLAIALAGKARELWAWKRTASDGLLDTSGSRSPCRSVSNRTAWKKSNSYPGANKDSSRRRSVPQSGEAMPKPLLSAAVC